MTFSNFIGLVDKYIMLELTNELAPTDQKADSIFRLRSRIIDELATFKANQARELSRLAPDFDKY